MYNYELLREKKYWSSTSIFLNQYFQLNITQQKTVYKKDNVIIEKHLNGEIKINFKEHYLDYKILPERPQKTIDIKLAALTIKESSNYKPPIDHPWRKFVINPQKVSNIVLDQKNA